MLNGSWFFLLENFKILSKHLIYFENTFVAVDSDCIESKYVHQTGRIMIL